MQVSAQIRKSQSRILGKNPAAVAVVVVTSSVGSSNSTAGTWLYDPVISDRGTCTNTSGRTVCDYLKGGLCVWVLRAASSLDLRLSFKSLALLSVRRLGILSQL